MEGRKEFSSYSRTITGRREVVGINWKEESQADNTEPFLPLSQESGYDYGHEKAVYLMAFSQLSPVVQLLKYPGNKDFLNSDP